MASTRGLNSTQGASITESVAQETVCDEALGNRQTKKNLLKAVGRTNTHREANCGNGTATTLLLDRINTQMISIMLTVMFLGYSTGSYSQDHRCYDRCQHMQH